MAHVNVALLTLTRSVGILEGDEHRQMDLRLCGQKMRGDAVTTLLGQLSE